MPIRTGVSPLALMMKGDANCTAASVAPVRKTVRRSTGNNRREVPMTVLPDKAANFTPAFFDAVDGRKGNPSGASLPMTIPAKNLQPSA